MRPRRPKMDPVRLSVESTPVKWGPHDVSSSDSDSGSSDDVCELEEKPVNQPSVDDESALLQEVHDALSVVRGSLLSAKSSDIRQQQHRHHHPTPPSSSPSSIREGQQRRGSENKGRQRRRIRENKFRLSFVRNDSSSSGSDDSDCDMGVGKNRDCYHDPERNTKTNTQTGTGTGTGKGTEKISVIDTNDSLIYL